jgi:hypothetical protein
VSFSIAILFLLIVVRAHTAHVVCEYDALTLRFAKTLGGGEMLQVEHRAEGAAEVLRRMLFYRHHHRIFYRESECVLYMVHVSFVSQMYKLLKKTNHCT